MAERVGSVVFPSLSDVLSVFRNSLLKMTIIVLHLVVVVVVVVVVVAVVDWEMPTREPEKRVLPSS